ncbi:MAG: hypothetical protein EA366_15645 [Spirulina sp. DLM2.Bin59]|nr:MAG: hypothetical protein EA366_15645 [Spirulina sp. DLM2.Bin59]
MATLIYPHLFCFSYHRKTQKNPEVDPSWQTWQDQHQNVQKVAKSNYGRYTGNDWDAIYEVKDLGDTQGLLLYAAVQEEHHPQPLDVLDPLRQRLEPLQGNIGQTWLVLTQWQPDETTTKIEAIAAIFKLWNLNPANPKPQGQFVGNTLYLIPLSAGQNLMICLAENGEMMNAFVDFRYELQRLFFYEHKIHWSHRQSQAIKQKLSSENFFPLTEDVIPASTLNLTKDQALQKNFAQLRGILYDNMDKLDHHTRGIEGLSLQLQTLKTNLKAYNQRLNRIQTLCQDYPLPSNLTLWSDFAANQATFYQEQIQQDIESLSPGLRVREQHIKTLQVIVEAAQGERDRALENTIAAAGLGVGVSSAAAGAWAGQTPRPIHTFGISLGLGLLSGVVVYAVLHFFRRNR